MLYNAPEKEGICDKCGGELICRADDEPETVRKRLVVYHTETEPLVKFYEERGLLVKAEGKKQIESTSREVRKALGLE